MSKKRPYPPRRDRHLSSGAGTAGERKDAAASTAFEGARKARHGQRPDEQGRPVFSARNNGGEGARSHAAPSANLSVHPDALAHLHDSSRKFSFVQAADHDAARRSSHPHARAVQERPTSRQQANSQAAASGRPLTRMTPRAESRRRAQQAQRERMMRELEMRRRQERASSSLQNAASAHQQRADKASQGDLSARSRPLPPTRTASAQRAHQLMKAPRKAVDKEVARDRKRFKDFFRGFPSYTRRRSLRRWVVTATAISMTILAFGVFVLSQSLAQTPDSSTKHAKPRPTATVKAPAYKANVTHDSVPLAVALKVPESNEVPSGFSGPIPESAGGETTVVPGTTPGNGDSKEYTYRLEYEKGLNINPQVLARSIHMILNDPRGWGFSFKRTDGNADFRIVIASPTLTDQLCAPLRTRGLVNCRNGSSVVLNIRRWDKGADMWTQLGRTINDYRIYEVNHETGHFLGHGHEFCPTVGTYAPTMQQQSADGGNNRGCIPNGWPKLDNKRP